MIRWSESEKPITEKQLRAQRRTIIQEYLILALILLGLAVAIFT